MSKPNDDMEEKKVKDDNEKGSDKGSIAPSRPYKPRSGPGGRPSYNKDDPPRPGGGRRPPFKSKKAPLKKAPKEKVDLGFDPSKEFAPIPKENPEQQRAICMVKGKLLIVDAKKNRGVLQIEKEHYPCMFVGKLKADKMAKKVNQELSFTGWPTGQVPSPKKGQLPLILLQLSALRKNVENPRYCQVRGIVANASGQKFQLRVHSPATQDTYTINVYGKCPAKNGDFLQIDGTLTPKALKINKWELIRLD